MVRGGEGRGRGCGEWWPCQCRIDAIIQNIRGKMRHFCNRRYIALSIDAIRAGTVEFVIQRSQVDSHISIGKWYVNANQRKAWDKALLHHERPIRNNGTPFQERPYWFWAKMA